MRILFALGLVVSACQKPSRPALSKAQAEQQATPSHLQQAQTGFLVNKLSERCLDVLGAPGVDNGAKLALYDCEYSGKSVNNQPTDQKWSLTPEGFIKNVLSGKCIDVWGAPGT